MIASINSVFSIFNRLFFDSNLSAPEIIVDVSKKVSLRWQSDENIIVMGSGFVNINKEIICANLLHEMIHLSNYKNKVIDVNDNQYHNSKFMKLAVKCGLVVYKDKNGVCYKYIATKADCDKNESRLKDFPLNK